MSSSTINKVLSTGFHYAWCLKELFSQSYSTFQQFGQTKFTCGGSNHTKIVKNDTIKFCLYINTNP